MFQGVEESADVDIEGGLYSYSVSAAAHVMPRLMVGGGVNILRGNADVKFNYAIEAEYEDLWGYSETISADVSADVNTKESGKCFSMGALYTVAPNLGVGAVYRTSARMTTELNSESETIVNGESTFTVTSKESKSTLPASVGAGVIYQYEQVLVIGEIHGTDWVEDDPSEASESPRINFRVGLEYPVAASMFSTPILLRAGFHTASLNPRPAPDTVISGYFVSGGMGAEVSGVKIDVAGQYGRRVVEVDSATELETSTINILGTLTYQFDLFK